MIRMAALLLMTAAALADTPPPEPDGYRGEPYNAPVPASFAAGQIVDAIGAIALHEQGAAFVDVYPRPNRKPDSLPADTLWNEPPHDTIPGAVWLWDTGYERLAPAEQARLETGLIEVTDGDKSAPVVIFCRADCWMSWNAAKRAVEMGYSAVVWFPGGTDDWQEAGGDLVRAEPVDP